MVRETRTRGAAEALASAQINAADGDCRVALLQLARRYDELEARHSELVARFEAFMGALPEPPRARAFRPTSHDEQARLDERASDNGTMRHEAWEERSALDARSEHDRRDEIANDRNGTYAPA